MTEIATKKTPTPKPTRSAKGTGTTVSADLKEHTALLEKIRGAAKADDRNISSWLRRKLVELDNAGTLIPEVKA